MRLTDIKMVPSREVELGVGLETTWEEERKKAQSLTEELTSSSPPRKALPGGGMSMGQWRREGGVRKPTTDAQPVSENLRSSRVFALS